MGPGQCLQHLSSSSAPAKASHLRRARCALACSATAWSTVCCGGTHGTVALLGCTAAHAGPLAVQVVQVDLARRVSELVHLVEDRAKIMEEHDMALAKLQLEAQKHPLVKESMEMAVLDAKYDLSLVNEAIRASQLGHKGEDVVGGRARTGRRRRCTNMQRGLHGARPAASQPPEWAHVRACVQVEAYITFVDDTGRDTCLAAQPKPWFTRLLPANRTPEPPRFREKHALTITQ